ncbi:hypothetical protein PsorP6_008716 [Peronosclerospora sorghi]|uniref:Uncharacterized protein n=1 Tax=Peronosclerospora sorghi TaxID=230839 RepID=A0ACC0W0Q9_9STRA|nr:hypothetical protein PsorP6_008716 [Peronosclerospora sorghi]
MSGDECRAEIPPLLTQNKQDASVYKQQYRQRWGEQHCGNVTLSMKVEDVEKFITKFTWLHETEVALQCLFDGEFDLQKAMRLLHANRRERHEALRDRNERLEPEAFKTAVETYGKKFHRVKQALGQKVTTQEVICTYYLWKQTTEYKNWRRRQKLKKCQMKRELDRLCLGDKSEVNLTVETSRGYHNRYCELCATGGKLLCCDGCARAYHFSCVQSPITTPSRKDDEWFCSYCQAVFGGAKPRKVLSDDNKYVLMCLPFPNFSCMPIESMVDTVSQEEDNELEENLDGNDDENFCSILRGDDVKNCDLQSGKFEEVTNNGLENTRANILSFPGVESGNSKQTLTRTAEVFAQNRQKGVESCGGSSLMGPSSPMKRVIEGSSAAMSGMRVSGRKRHRKIMAPRRIPPPQFDR